MRVLVTRPAAEAERTAARLRALGHEPISAPMLSIEYASDAVIEQRDWSAVIMTSGNAARALAQHAQAPSLIHLKCFAVGEQTAAAAKKAGFSEVISAGGDGADLGRVIAAHRPVAAHPLLYLAGSDRARDLTQMLAPEGLRVETVVLYRAIAAQALPAHVVAAFSAHAVDAVLHYSRRTAAIFVECCRTQQLLAQAASLKHFCLSQRAAEPLRSIGARHIRVAEHPDENAMLALIGD
jgi:uroporphyrinogen-III synthase